MCWGGGFTPCMTRQVTVEASTLRGLDTSLLAQYLNGRLASADSLQTETRVRLEVIPFADEAIRELVTFAFVESHLFSVRVRHVEAVVELLCLIDIPEEIHTKVQGIITSPHLTTKVLNYVSRRWSM